MDAPALPLRRPPSALVFALVAAGATLAAHGFSLFAGFAWDDQHTVLSNPALQSLGGLLQALAADDWRGYGLRARGLYRPLATLSLAMDHALFGFRAAGYHFTSLALHSFTSFALMRILTAAGVRASATLFAGVLFAVHPLGAEVADWISARPDGLSAALAIAAIWAALRDRPLLAVALAGTAPFAKEPGIVALPAVIVVLAVQSPRRSLLRATALGLVALAGYLFARRIAAVPIGAAAAALDVRALPGVLGRFGEVTVGWLGAFLFPLPLDLARRIPDLGLWRWPAAALAPAGSLLLLFTSWQRRSALPATLVVLWIGPLLLLAAWAPNLSERYLYLPSLAAAQAACDRAVALDPLDPRPRYNRALLDAAKGRADAAREELRRLAVEFPGYRPAREGLIALEGPER